MSISPKLASAQGRRDEQPNIELAQAIAKSQDQSALAELVEILTAGDRPLRHDAIKALYETGERKPALIAPFVDIFIGLLQSKDNRLVWGAMSALAALAAEVPEKLMAAIEPILTAADRGSVISKDKAMVILAALNTDPRYHEILMPVIFTRLMNAATNQAPMYAELTFSSLQPADYPRFRKVVEARIADIPQPAKKARLAKLLKKLEKK